MRIAFISPTNLTTGHGLRVLAQYVVECGHEVQLIFISQPTFSRHYEYPDSIYTDLARHVAGSDVAAFSFTSNHFPQACRLSRFIRGRFAIPIIWGGIHAMGAPQGSLEWADIVCIGEGEQPLRDILARLSQNSSYADVPGICFKADGKAVTNAALPPVADLDTLPFPFYDDSREVIREGDRLVGMTQERREREFLAPMGWYGPASQSYYPYLTMMGRGCPNSCTYCCNNLYKGIYGRDSRLVRRRTAPRVIDELRCARAKMPFVNLVEFFDDDFTSAPCTAVEEFAVLYKEHVGLPFRCCMRPGSAAPQKIAMLVDAGLALVEIGLQSASPATNRLYHRPFNPEAFLEATRAISRYPHVRMQYDIIIDNPFEQNEDLAQTFRFLAVAPPACTITPFSLTFFPGTELHAHAVKFGLLKDKEDIIPEKRTDVLYESKSPYVHFVLFVLRKAQRYHVGPVWVMNLLTDRWVMSVGNSGPLRWFWFGVLQFTKVVSPSYMLRRIRRLLGVKAA